MAPEFSKPIPGNRAQKKSRPRAAQYPVPVRHAFEIKYSESMREPRLPKSAFTTAQMRQAEAGARRGARGGLVGVSEFITARVGTIL